MKTITDEMLMAYADGELDAPAAADVRSALTADPELQSKFDRMNALDELLRSSVQADLSVPDRFSRLLAEDPQPETNVVPLSSARRKNSVARWFPTGVGVAAALMIVAGSSMLSAPAMTWLNQVDDGLALAGPVKAAIVSTVSGGRVEHKGLNVMPVVSFVSNDGRLCREAQLDDDEMAARVVACRDVDHDEWCIEAFARMPAITHKGGYTTAGVPKDPVIDAAYARLGIKTTLSTQAEKDAISKNWAQ